MCSTHREDGSWMNCCVMNCQYGNTCYFNECKGMCGGIDLSYSVKVGDGISIDYNGIDTIYYEGTEIKVEGWGHDKESKLREMALSLAAKLKWEEEDINWPAVIYEALDRARKL